jgi:type III secretion protein V
MNRGTRPAGGAWHRADIVLSALVVAIVAMMVVPLPTPLLDLLIAMNLTLGVLLLTAALYVREPLNFAAFPTILLLSTLYRLALNVSSTRLILLQADAGRVIEAFGKFVVRGDYLVGAMVFAILTLIQFIVIARGAERVAEVGARFSLDAMPGKQLSIDAEQRAGNLSTEAARVLRKRLERESQLYGALDGAMKFVKGDAIAGIVITLVNFIGGVAIGATQRGLDLKSSLATYGLLTIGDGLVTQIPALLGATAAGLVVTRVASEDHEHSLASDIVTQLFADKRVLAVAAFVLVSLALVPGLPAWPFALSAACLGMLLVRVPAEHAAVARAPHSELRPRDPLVLEVAASESAAWLSRGQPAPELTRALSAVQQELTHSFGVPIPTPVVRIAPGLAAGSFRWIWRELPERTQNLPGDPVQLAATLTPVVRRYVADCLGLEAVQSLLDRLEREQPALVRHTVPKTVSQSLLAQVLRGLVREGVSVRWLPDILEALAQLSSANAVLPPTPQLVEEVRRALGRRISRELAPEGTLHLLRLSGTLEETVADALRRDGSSEWLALPADLSRDISEALRSALHAAPRPCALLTQASLRRHVRALVEQSSLELAVVSAHELEPDLILTRGAPIGP